MLARASDVCQGAQFHVLCPPSPSYMGFLYQGLSTPDFHGLTKPWGNRLLETSLSKWQSLDLHEVAGSIQPLVICPDQIIPPTSCRHLLSTYYMQLDC